MIRLSTGNQWRSFNTGVMCSRFLDNVTNRAAVFWMRCNLLNSNFGSPYKKLLFESRREETKAWTSFSVLLRSKYLRMRPMFLIECEARRLMLLTWGTKVRCWSMMTPRSFALATVSTTESPTLMEGMGTVSEKREDKYTTSVLLSFKASLFSNVQFLISLMQFLDAVQLLEIGNLDPCFCKID